MQCLKHFKSSENHGAVKSVETPKFLIEELHTNSTNSPKAFRHIVKMMPSSQAHHQYRLKFLNIVDLLINQTKMNPLIYLPKLSNNKTILKYFKTLNLSL